MESTLEKKKDCRLVPVAPRVWGSSFFSKFEFLFKPQTLGATGTSQYLF